MFEFITKYFKSYPEYPFPNPENYKYWWDRVDEFKQDNRQGGILFVGDSITDGFRNLMPEFFNDKIRNQGIAGDTTVGLKKRLDCILQAAPDKIFLMIGSNNIGCHIIKGKQKDMFIYGDTKIPINKVAKEYLEDLTFIINVIKKGLPETQIFIENIIPINSLYNYNIHDLLKLLKTRNNIYIIHFNELIKTFCYINKLTYIDLFTPFFELYSGQCKADLVIDGCHPSRLGYEVWKQEIQNYL